MSTQECTVGSHHICQVDKLNYVRETVVAGLSATTASFYIIHSFPVHAKLSCLAQVTPTMVKTLIQSVPVKTSPMNILPTSLQAYCDKLSVLIAHIANASFKAARFLASMKVGQVTPLFKKSGLGTNNYKNFRPITNFTRYQKSSKG